jgi:hypothetical protein
MSAKKELFIVILKGGIPKKGGTSSSTAPLSLELLKWETISPKQNRRSSLGS